MRRQWRRARVHAGRRSRSAGAAATQTRSGDSRSLLRKRIHLGASRYATGCSNRCDRRSSTSAPAPTIRTLAVTLRRAWFCPVQDLWGSARGRGGWNRPPADGMLRVLNASGDRHRMKSKPHRAITAFCEDWLAKYGDNALGVGWPRGDAEVRYRVMMDLIRPSSFPVTLLDFGCGASHLYEYILKHGTSGSGTAGSISRSVSWSCREEIPGRSVLSGRPPRPASPFVAVVRLCRHERDLQLPGRPVAGRHV